MARQPTRRVVVLAAFAGLLATVYAANYLVRHVGVVRVWPTTLRAPAGVYVAGVAFLFRDTVQRLGSVRLALLGIACGAALSVAVSPRLAVASAAAFALSESAGLVTLWALSRWLYVAVAAAQLVGAAIDSAAFLWLAFGSLALFPGQLVGKLLVLALAYPVLIGWRRCTVTA